MLLQLLVALVGELGVGGEAEDGACGPSGLHTAVHPLEWQCNLDKLMIVTSVCMLIN